MLKTRSVGVSILLTLVTCGLYQLYWLVMLTDEANQLSGDHKTSGGTALLFTIITCGIYGLYWSYQMGKKMYKAQERAGLPANDNSILYLVLTLFGVGIIAYAIIQSDINDILEKNHVAA